MFSKSIQYYDLIYNELKDYKKEATEISAAIRQYSPNAKTVLDTACGTGSHAMHLASDHGYTVDGLDLEAGFLEIARKKHPAGMFYEGNLADFQISKKYDVILCLFSSIAYLKTKAGITEALRRFQRHLNPGGIAIVEAWFTPETAKPSHFVMNTVNKPDIQICRMAQSRAIGRISHIYFEYLINSASGIEHFSENHELGILSAPEMKDCFRQAGFEVEQAKIASLSRDVYIGKNLEKI